MSSVFEAMRNPAFYTPPPDHVEIHETHISCVYIAGERVFKLKKKIVLPFLDYGSLARRRAMCELEVTLNRRLAPEIYVGVRKVISASGRYRLVALDDPGDAVEYAVEMRFVDPANRLDQRLSDPANYTAPKLRDIGARFAAFHAAAQTVTGDVQRVHAWVAEQFDELAAYRELLPPDVTLLATNRALKAFLAKHVALLEHRCGAGFVRDVHGDLRAEHVIVEPTIAVLDCIEFNPNLRRIDVSADLAFLVMDLHLRGHTELAQILISGYQESGGDAGPLELLYFYATLRALIRAKVNLIRAVQQDRGRDRTIGEAVRRLRLAERLRWQTRRPLVLVVCGVSGSGKTVLARELAEQSGFSHIASDVVRKALAGLDSSRTAAPAHYSPAFTMRTYDRLAELAVEEVGARGGVIVDATFRRHMHRRRFVDALAQATVTPVFLECRAPPELLKQRVHARLERGRDASDARPELIDAQLAEFDSFDNEDWPHAALNSALAPDDLACEAEAALDELWLRSEKIPL